MALVVSLVAGLLGCFPPDKSAETEVQRLARQKWQGLCVSCHGEYGRGDGPAAANLDPKPRNYADAKWQRSVGDERLRRVIIEGGAALGLNAAMPPNPDLKDKPEVVAALVRKVRSFGPKDLREKAPGEAR